MLRQKIIETMRSVAADSGVHLVKNMEDETLLLDSGLDSIEFAVLVARLEEELGYDPFTMMDEPFYPINFGQFLSLYERFAK